MHKLKKGFTLVELLVVISIIAILLAILMPTLSQARTQAKMIIDSTRQRSVMTAVTCYSSEYGGKLPPSTQGQCRPADKTKATYWTLPIRLKYYYTTARALNGGSVMDILGMYMKDPVNWNCPMANDSIDWQKRYFAELKDSLVEMLDCSYMLYWNFLGYYKEETGVTGITPFGFNPVMGRDTLMMSDIFLHTDSFNAAGGDYMSAHPFKGSSLRQLNNYVNQRDTSGNVVAVKLFMGKTGGKVPLVKLNAAYLDNHVEKFNTQTGVLTKDGNILPAKWK